MFLNDIKYNWIGDIPKNWEVKRIKNLFYLKKEVSENPEQEQVLSLTMNGIIKRDVSSNEGQLPDTYKGYTKIYPDDIVMNPMDLRSGWIDRSKYNGIISPSYYVLNKLNNNLDIQFFTYQLQRHYKEKIFFSFGQGVSYDYRWGLGRETILNFPIVVPPLEIQTHIVSFLDTKTQKIDELIEKTEQKIKLLKEKRTSLINHCVTKGLKPDVEMKDSGVDWIGEIPSEWRKTKIKYEVEIFGRIGFRGYTVDDIVDEGKGVITISPSNIKNDTFNLDNRTYLSWEKYHESPEIQIFTNDIILVKTGSTIGKTSIIPKNVSEMTLNPQLIVFKNIKMNPKYLYYQTVCKFIKESFHIEQTGSTTPTISQEKINEFPLIKPDYEEQTQIVEYLDEQTQKIDSTIENETQRIELLKEYRQSLISELVTGKIDVRDWNK